MQAHVHIQTRADSATWFKVHLGGSRYKLATVPLGVDASTPGPSLEAEGTKARQDLMRHALGLIHRIHDEIGR